MEWLQPPYSAVGVSQLKARTHRPILRGFDAESAVELAILSQSSTTNFTMVGRLSISNMFNILKPLESADGNRPTIAVGRRQMGLVGTGLYKGNAINNCCMLQHFGCNQGL